jgi:hypothetical protein
MGENNVASDNFRRLFYASDIKVDCSAWIPQKEVGPDGIREFRLLTVSVQNKSDYPILWLNIEVIHGSTSSETNQHFSNRLDGKGIQVDSRTTAYSHWEKSTFPIKNLNPGQEIELKSEINPSHDIGPKVYQIYGELDSGKKFSERRYGCDLDFNGDRAVEKKGGCFVVTAAYGNPEHHIVNDYREFRDRVLEGTTLGDKFIKWYYKHGEALAHYIDGRPITKVALRSILFPGAACIRFLLKFLPSN